MTLLFLKGVAMKAAVTSAAPRTKSKHPAAPNNTWRASEDGVGLEINAQASSGVLVSRYIFNHTLMTFWLLLKRRKTLKKFCQWLERKLSLRRLVWCNPRKGEEASWSFWSDRSSGKGVTKLSFWGYQRIIWKPLFSLLVWRLVVVVRQISLPWWTRKARNLPLKPTVGSVLP